MNPARMIALLIPALVAATSTTTWSHERPARRRLVGCAPANALSSKLQTWTTHTARDGSSYASAQRTRTAIPANQTDSVFFVWDNTICDSLAFEFARRATARDTTTPRPVTVIAIGSTAYLVTDLLQGETEASKTINPDGTVTYSEKADWTEVLSIVRNSNARLLWRWTYVSTRATPY